MRIVGLKSEYSCQFKRQAVEPHPCDCSKLFGPIKHPDVLGKIVVNQETNRTTRANLCGLVTSRKVVLCGRNGTFVVTVFSSGGFRSIKWHLQDVLTFQHPNDGQRTAIESDTTMGATDV